MCGIAGFIGGSNRDQGQLAGAADRMAAALGHRGPDAGGVWVEPGIALALAHRRLSVVDLTPTGAQPMQSADGRLVVTFNGEIYNFREIRDELRVRGRTFRGTSDTEVLLESVAEWGVEGAVQRFVGMFAFALYDGGERRLHLVRDRLGEKPLYYGWSNGVFLFGSELKALRAHPAWGAAIDRDAVAMYFRQGNVPAPFSIYQGIFKLPPGSWLNVRLDHFSPNTLPDPEYYWRVKDAVESGIREPFAGNDTEALAQLESLLRQAVTGQMIADVPIGAFLSGGVDSSVIVALMQERSSRPVKTFTIGFTEEEYNEAGYAQAVAAHLGTEHTELYVTPEDARAVIPKLPHFYDEPFSDSSQIPTYLVSALARQHVTVSLSGDGGDELFGGYRRYQDTLSLARKINAVPRFARRPLSRVIRGISVEAWERIVGWMVRRVMGAEWHGRTGDRLHKAAHLLEYSDVATLYLRQVCRDPRFVPQILDGTAEQLPLECAAREGLRPTANALALMTYLDIIGYLPDDILVKVDRASMAVSLESRIPLLDHRVVEFATSLPLKYKLRDGQNKWLLRQLLYRHVPRALIDRPKMGFGVPIEHWLRGPLKDWAENLMSEDRLRREGYINPKRVRQMWAEHVGGTRRWHNHLWDVLMFQAWLEVERA